MIQLMREILVKTANVIKLNLEGSCRKIFQQYDNLARLLADIHRNLPWEHYAVMQQLIAV